jgi:hypothetical protein
VSLRRTLALAPWALLVAACAAPVPLDRVEHRDMGPRLSYRGFSFARPPNPHWYLLQSEQSVTEAVLWREVRPVSRTHDLRARIAIGSLARAPGSHEEFATLARRETQQAPWDVRTLAYEQEPVVRQGRWCIRFAGSWSVIGAPEAPLRQLVMRQRGYRCLHPSGPAATLDFFVSERGRPEELDPALLAEGERWLEDVHMDRAPGVPVGPGDGG